MLGLLCGDILRGSLGAAGRECNEGESERS
jgi:hypothetical protein